MKGRGQMAEFKIGGVRLEVPDVQLTEGVRQQLNKGTYEWAEAKALGEVLRKGDRVLDLGSAIGFVACCAAQVLGVTT